MVLLAVRGVTEEDNTKQCSLGECVLANMDQGQIQVENGVPGVVELVEGL